MYKVLIRDNMALCAREILTATGQIEVVIDNDKENGKPENLANIIADYDGLAIRSGTQVTKQVLENAPRLKVIGRAGIGVDNIDTAAATQKGVVVMNAPGGNTRTTAEHAVAMMLALARNIPQGTSSLRSGLWEKKNLRGIELTAKTLGIFGLGHIGKIVAELAQGLKMKVVACDPFVRAEAARELGVEMLSADELLAMADFISLHVPRLPETTNMINAATISKMKPGVRLINCARGEVVNLEDLYAALESGQVAGAALDVLPKEPPDPDLPILSHPHVILTPHLGASTGEAQNKVAQMIANQMAAYLTDGVIVNAVNFPSVPPEVFKQLKPHLQLAERMGAVMGQLVRSIHDINITYSGEIAHLTTKPLTHAILKGLLGAFTDQPVNHVNAPVLAEQKGMKVKETVMKDQGHYNGLIKVKLEGCQVETDEIWGAVFEHSYQRIVRLGKIYMDAIPEGAMIVIQNIDKPGVIGNVGTVLGRHDINIGRFQLGRREDRALCMVNVDTPADDSVLAELKNLPNILAVQQVILNNL